MLECWNLPNDGIALSWCAKNSLAEQLLASAGLTCLPLFQSLPSSVPLEMCNNKYLLNENNKQRWFYQGKRWKPFLTDLMYTCSFWNWAGPCGASGMEAFIRRIDAFELWCWRRLLRVPWTSRRSNQSLLKEISPGCSLEGMMLKLKLQYFGHLMWRVDSLEKTLMLGGVGAGGEGDDRGWDGWMASPTLWTWVWVNSRCWWWTGRPVVHWFMGSQRVGHDWATEL